MLEIGDILNIAIEDLSPEQPQQLKDATDQFFQQKCLMSFKKNRSGVSYLKNEMPRVLLSGETDATTLQEKEECMQAFRDAAEDVLGKQHRAFLGVFKQMMVGVFGPGMEQVFSRVSPQGYCMEVGESSSAQPGTQQPLRSQPVQPPP
jgi:cyclopropane fatty-acyl-phospholipid synthase-like methyltransferase